MRKILSMTGDASDAERTHPITIRMPENVVDWLKRKQAEHRREGLRVSIPALILQSLERDKRLDEQRPHGPKKARPAT